MKRTAIFLAVSGFTLCPALFANADEATLQELRAQVAVLTERLNEMEAKTKVMEEKTNQVVATAKPATSWADRIQWHGDVRYRIEQTDKDSAYDDINRNRIRARIGLTAQVSDDFKAGVALASGSESPTSANQTLGGGGSSKQINLDMAWIDWNFAENLNLVAGKTKNPFYTPGGSGLVWDSDYRPEGGHLSYDNGSVWAIAAYHFLNSYDGSKGTDDIEEMFGAQLGYNARISEKTSLKVGTSYLYIPVAGSAAFFEDSDGNAEFFGNTGIGETHALDYEVAEVFAELNTKLAGIPTILFADYVKNTDSDADEDTGYGAGFKLGKVKGRGDLAFSYLYQDLEADAVFAAFADSDFAGGGTDVKGHKYGAYLGLSKNTTASLSYYDTEIGKVRGDGKKSDYDAIKLNVEAKF
jgi:putative porin